MIYTIEQASQMLDDSFSWLSINDASFIVIAYVWATYAEHKGSVSHLDIECMKAIILVWLANSASEEAQEAVRDELISAVS